jgi:hypothetical protein
MENHTIQDDDLFQEAELPSAFRKWITSFLINSSSRVPLNEVTKEPSSHGVGLYQGTLLIWPLLLVLTIDNLSVIFEAQ